MVQGFTRGGDVGQGAKTPSSLPDLQRTAFSRPEPTSPTTPGQLVPPLSSATASLQSNCDFPVIVLVMAVPHRASSEPVVAP